MSKDDRELIERLKKSAETSSRISREMAEAKSLRQGDCDPPRADLYMWSKPEDTLEGRAATRLEALQAQPVGEENGWLIEENASGIIHWIALAENEWPRTEIHVRRARSGRDMMVETDKYRSPVVRVKDANEALRFARKEDAEALIKLFDRFLLCPVATEHMWSAAR